MKIWQGVTYRWTEWFAWYPVKDWHTEETIWLETVERKIESAKIPNVVPLSWTAYRRISREW